MRNLLRRPSPGTVLSVIAIVLAMGGTSFAAAKLAANSVGTRQLKANAVTGAKIKSGAVASSDVANGSLTAADFKAGQIPAGPKGDKGDKGDTGAAGTPGSTGPQGPSAAFHAFNNSIQTSPVSNVAFWTVLTLPAPPAGNYVIDAKASIENDHVDTLGERVDCRLTAGAKIDSSSEGLDDNAQNSDFATVALQLATTLDGSTPVVLSCNNPGGNISDTDVDHVHITALQVASLTGGQ